MTMIGITDTSSENRSMGFSEREIRYQLAMINGMISKWDETDSSMKLGLW